MKYLEAQREQDAELYAALQVPPPDGLADRILVARGLRDRRWVWPLAAGIVLAAGLGLLWPRAAALDPLGTEAIVHVSHEPGSFTASQAVPAGFLPGLLASQGMSMSQALQVTYAVTCPFGGRKARHLVVQTEAGPVTLFLLADDPQSRKRSVTERDGMAAVVIPAATGSITLVGARLEQVLALEKKIRST
jgi:hypothetical protein